MAHEIKLLDGATGTKLWEKAAEKVPVWRYNIEDPGIVVDLHKEYIAAGSQLIYANTFGANRENVMLTDYSVEQIVRSGIVLAKEAAKGTGTLVALDAGPLNQIMEPYGDLEEDEVEEIYSEMFNAGMQEQPDCVVLETFLDLNMMEVAARCAKEHDIPVYCTLSFEKVGKTMFGQSIEDVVDTLAPLGVDGLGLNCNLTPDLALPVIKQFRDHTDLPIFYKPNAGKPILAADGSVSVPYSAEDFAKDMLPAFDFVDYIGGCCGSAPSFIAALKSALASNN